jgi:hypothetical protein
MTAKKIDDDTRRRVGLTAAAMHTLEAGFEDGERREDIGNEVDLPELATAYAIWSATDANGAGIKVRFADGSLYMVEITVRRLTTLDDLMAAQR